MPGIDEGDGVFIGGGRDDGFAAEIGEHGLGLHKNELFVLDHQNPLTREELIHDDHRRALVR
jgi:hypothetical protein